MKRRMTSTAVLTAVLTILFTIFYIGYKQKIFLTLAISFGTVCYHFTVRLLVGLWVNIAIRHPINYRAKWFSQSAAEVAFYNRIRIKHWKKRLPTYAPETFSLKLHTPEEIVQAMCVAELVHEIILPFSFLPLLMAIPFGDFPVFFITSILSCGVDIPFILIQRYNRPRMIKLIQKRAGTGE